MNLPMFASISNMSNIKEIDNIILKKISLNKDSPIARKIKEITKWEENNENESNN
jgi:hypothetical protein